MTTAQRDPAGTSKVDAFLAELEHPHKPAIELLRSAILASEDGITEHVKWNAPSFRFDDVDRATFRLQPGNRLQLILHRGAKLRDDADEFRFEDPAGLLEWVAADRAVINFVDLADAKARLPEVVELIRRWMLAA
jgi:hypothetical protein